MSAANNQNRKLQNLINIGKMADDSVGSSELVDNSVINAALGANQPKTLVFLFDPAATSGFRATGTHVCTDADGDAQTMPDNSIIIGYHLDVVTAFNSAGSATIALGVVTDGAASIKAATAYDNAAYVAATQVGGTPVASVKMTAARNLIAVVATAALTSTYGKMYIYIQYIEGT